MNSKLWAEMSARERDALVAAKVMELTIRDAAWLQDHRIYDASPSDVWSDDAAAVLSIRDGATNRIPAYTIDIAAAWQVLERMTDPSRDDQCTFQMRRITGWNDPVWGYDVRFGRKHDPTRQSDRIAWAHTAPEAICLAALKAVGVEV